jgi:hypothetical protein
MESSKELQIVVDFYRLFLKQPLNSDTRLVENYLIPLFDRLVIANAPPGASHREIINYRAELLDFIKSGVKTG